MADFLDQKRKEIAERIAELRPQVDEYTELAAFAKRAGIDVDHDRRGPGRPRGTRSVAKPATGSRRGRVGRLKGTGKRAAETLSVIEATPGLKVAEIAEKTAINKHYLYRVLAGLEDEGKIENKNGSWYPKTRRGRSRGAAAKKSA